MATTAPSSSRLTNGTSAADSKIDLLKQLKSHEIAIAELDNLPSSRAVYQRNGNLFFRTTIQRATAMEQKQLDSAKAKLKILNSSS
ncbi:Lactate utilization protein like [Senna tora]|uniref:Lactate utilization protein like n=1 Tax=Senna tora TaxID=362788 RepID=A0A834SH42_9FABA|nr:Lactate utilization protein like [Senna tora]